MHTGPEHLCPALNDRDRQLVRDFREAAGAYCTLLDSFTDGRPDALYATLHRLLTRIAATQPGLTLPCDPLEFDPGHYARHELTQEATIALLDRIATTVSRETAWADHLQGEWADEVLERRLRFFVEDLGDLYQDLKAGLNACAAGSHEALHWAIERWYYGYPHWGEHLYNALSTVHAIRFHPEMTQGGEDTGGTLSV